MESSLSAREFRGAGLLRWAMPNYVLGDPPEWARIRECRGGVCSFRGRSGTTPADWVLIEALPIKSPGRVLVGLDHAGVAYMAASALWGSNVATWWHYDAYAAAAVRNEVEANGVNTAGLVIGEDVPGFVPQGESLLVTGRGAAGDALSPEAEPFDLIALPFPATGEALLTREILEQAHDRLVMGGRLVAATDKDPSWLKGAVESVFGKADVSAVDRGSAVWATRKKERTAWKDHSHVLQVDLPPKPLGFLTRPGVFSYGRLDRGTKALLKVLEVGAKARILDLGCGYGVMGAFALARSPGSSAVLVDCNARAVGAARRSMVANSLTGATVLLRRDLENIPGGPFDLVVANPPYFGDFRIADAFVSFARDRIAPNGKMFLVAKAGEAHREIVARKFGEARTEMLGTDTYFVITARP